MEEDRKRPLIGTFRWSACVASLIADSQLGLVESHFFWPKFQKRAFRPVHPAWGNEHLAGVPSIICGVFVMGAIVATRVFFWVRS